MLALVLGSVLAVVALAYVMLPLLRGASEASGSGQDVPELPPESSALEALREIEFDEATGKLSPEDYATLKATYTPLALDELRKQEAADASVAQAAAAEASGVGGAVAAIADPAEAMIARAKQRGSLCPEHGKRPEADALFCSDCGRFLGAACLSCGAPVSSETARFCTECGAALAA